MPITQIKFTELENTLADTNFLFSDYLAPDIGRAYVISITRDGCPACDKQKPQLQNLASELTKNHRNKVAFTQIHVRHPAGDQTESVRSKHLLGHYFYPTTLILLRSHDTGVFEYYRSVSPLMDELKRNIKGAIQIAEFLEEPST